VNRPPYTALGKCHAIRKVIEEARLVAATDFNVLLKGEPGAGKELLAQFIHEHSPRQRHAMRSVNCAHLAKSQFPDHNGAPERVFGVAGGGTLLLDEVGELGPRLQSQLLAALDSKVKIRVISTTTEDLLPRVADGSFVADLYYRLNVAHLQIPALRERRQDVPFLMRHRLKALSEQFRVPLCELHPSALASLEGYTWPGNIGELRDIAELLALTHPGEIVAADQLPETIVAQREHASSTAEPVATAAAGAVMSSQYEQMPRASASFWVRGGSGRSFARASRAH